MTGQAQTLRCQHLIVTIYGLYARKENDALPVASLIRVLGQLGVEPAGIRSSVSRLKQRGVLESRRAHGVAQYAIAPESRHIFLDGDSRIYAPTRAGVGEPWLFVLFSVPEQERAKRHVLRSELTRLGFGAVSSGVWVAPMIVRAQAERQLRHFRLDSYVEFFSVEYLAPGKVLDKVAQWWDLEKLDALYGAFVRCYEQVLSSWATRLAGPSSGELGRDAFVDHVTMLTEWRRLPYLDPGLPLELLPNGWNGVAAERIFNMLHTIIGPHAREYIAPMVVSSPSAP